MAVRIPIKTEGGQQAVNEMEKVGDAGQSALDRINRASKEPSVGLRALSGATTQAREALDGMASSTGAVGRILSSLGPIGIAAGAAIGVFTIGLSHAIREADKAESSRLKIEALLRTTQNASGQTYQSISQIADSIALSTMATGDAVEEAAAMLLTFKSVAGDAFGRTLTVAQDMAAVMGGDMKSAITQLGKALEDPERNLSALNRSGISFNETQIETIKYLVESGDKTRALGEILNVLEGQIGGAGKAEAGTLSGAFHNLTERVGMFLEKVGNTGPLQAFTDIVRTMAEGMGIIDAAIFKDLDTQIADKFKEVSDLQERINSGSGRGRNNDTQLRGRLAGLREELKLLTDKRQAEAAAAVAAQQAAQASKISASEEAIAAKMRESSEKRMDELQKDRDQRLKTEAAERKRIAAAQATATKSINDQIDSLENEQKALALAERERAIFVELLKAEETARKGGISVTNEQREAIIKETGALFDQRKAIDDRKKAEEEATREAEKQQRERERIAEREAAELRKPFEHAAEGIQDTLTDAIEKGLNGSLDTAADVFEQIKRIAIRAAAEVASAWIIRPAIASTGFFGAGAASAGTTGAQLAAGGGGVSLNPLSMASSFLGPAGTLLGLGGLGGGLIGSLTGGNTLGSSIGGALGAYGGVLAGSGVLGGATGALTGLLGEAGNFVIPGLGMVLGALAGGLLGGSGPSNKSAWGNIDLSSGALGKIGNMTGDKFSQETVNARDKFFQAIQGFSQALQQITGGSITGRVSADIGLRDGTQVGGLGAGRYGTPEQALQAIFRGMLDNIQGVDTEFRQVFARLDLTNLEQAVQDLGIAASIINKDYVQSEPLNAAAQAIKNLNDQFKPLIDNAQRLGLSIAPISSELSRQIGKLTTDFNAQIDDMILGITDPMAAALKQQEQVAQDRLVNARTLGADLVDVERLNALERQKIIEQYGDQSVSSLLQANQTIEQFLSNLRGGSGSFLSPAATLANAESEFQRLLGLAQGGDVAARSNITGAASNLINASRESFGSTDMFFQRLNFIDSTLSNLVGQNNNTTTFDNIGITIAQGNATTEYQLKQLNDKIAYLTSIIAEQQATLVRLAAA